MVRLGLDLPDDLRALVCASHSGEDFHLDGVRRILAVGGLDESALQTPPDYPLDDTAREAAIRAGRAKDPISMNCSGKHAGMLVTCVVNGWDTATYLSPDHPLQQAIAATFSEHTGEPIEAVAVDGCGAPLLSCSLTGLARAFRTARPRRGRAGAPDRRRHPPAPRVRVRHHARRARPAAGDPRRDRQGRRRVLLRGRPPRRPGVRLEDRRRRSPGAAGADGCGAGAQRRRRRGRSRRPAVRATGVVPSSAAVVQSARSAPASERVAARTDRRRPALGGVKQVTLTQFAFC